MHISLKELNENISKIEPLCPWCSTSGQKIMIQTVKSLCENRNINEDADYYLCLSPNCPAGYFSKIGEVIHKAALSVPIWFKEKSPVPICYCQDVTDAQIWEHVAINRCCNSLEDIQAHTGANTGCQCNLRSPSGK